MKKIILRPHPYTAENEIINIIHKKLLHQINIKLLQI